MLDSAQGNGFQQGNTGSADLLIGQPCAPVSYSNSMSSPFKHFSYVLPTVFTSMHLLLQTLTPALGGTEEVGHTHTYASARTQICLASAGAALMVTACVLRSPLKMQVRFMEAEWIPNTREANGRISYAAKRCEIHQPTLHSEWKHQNISNSQRINSSCNTHTHSDASLSVISDTHMLKSSILNFFSPLCFFIASFLLWWEKSKATRPGTKTVHVFRLTYFY